MNGVLGRALNSFKNEKASITCIVNALTTIFAKSGMKVFCTKYKPYTSHTDLKFKIENCKFDNAIINVRFSTTKGMCFKMTDDATIEFSCEISTESIENEFFIEQIKKIFTDEKDIQEKAKAFSEKFSKEVPTNKQFIRAVIKNENLVSA